jgi:hypothetical protein
MTVQDAQIFQLIMAGVQNILISIGLIVGGSWTLYTFQSLFLKRKAKVDLEKLQWDLEKTRADIETARFRQAVVKIDIDARQENLGSDKLCIAIVATIENLGNENTRLLFTTRPAFEVELVEFPVDGGVRHVVVLQGNADLEYMTLRAKASHRFHYFGLVDNPGLYRYIVRFSVPLSNDDMLIHEKTAQDASFRANREIVWSNSGYLVVTPPGDITAA